MIISIRFVFMNRYIANTLVAAAAVGFVAPASASLPYAQLPAVSATPFVASDEDEPQMSAAMALAVELLAEMEVMAELLENCDSSNADDTAARVEVLLDLMKETLKKVERMQETDPEEMAKIDHDEYLKEQADAAINRAQKAVHKLRVVDYYGSSDLKTVLQNLGS